MVAIATTCMGACATTSAQPARAPTSGDAATESCGEELANSAAVPEQIAALMEHVAKNLDVHARWVGTTTTVAQQEHDALTRLAHDYRRIAVSARHAASAMRAMRDLPIEPHDPALRDQKAFTRWMSKKVVLQRALAKLLSEHADTSQRMLAETPPGTSSVPMTSDAYPTQP